MSVFCNTSTFANHVISTQTPLMAPSLNGVPIGNRFDILDMYDTNDSSDEEYHTTSENNTDADATMEDSTVDPRTTTEEGVAVQEGGVDVSHVMADTPQPSQPGSPKENVSPSLDTGSTTMEDATVEPRTTTEERGAAVMTMYDRILGDIPQHSRRGSLNEIVQPSLNETDADEDEDGGVAVGGT